MILVVAFEAIFSVMLICFVLTQIIVPIARGTKLFPMFSKVGKIEGEVAETKSEIDVAKMEKEVEVLKEEVKKEKEN